MTVELSCNQTIFGRTVNVTRKYKTSLRSYENVINICEVQIWVCTVGYFRDKCDQPCGKCMNGVCSRYAGACRNGWCQPGYTGHTCMDNCEGGFFGDNCSSKCGRCKDQQACHHVDGRCVQGCAPGWISPMCVDKCKVGFFGNNCSQMCANCLNVTDCHHETGVCGNGCAEGYTGRTCEADTDRQNKCTSTSGPVAAAVGGSIACGVVGFLLGILFMRCRLHQPRNVQASVARFHQISQTEYSSSPPGESRPPRGDSAVECELTSQPANIYDALEASRDDNVYVNLA